MPKGKKSCPKCNLELGVRVQKCDCGHEFSKTISPVPASDQPMTIEPLDKRIAESVGNVRDLISKAERRVSDPVPKKASEPRRTVIVEPVRTPRFYSGGGKIATPAGECPVKPKGYKENWPDGPASDEVVQNWAIDVDAFGEGRYAVDAVIYFARYFWNINGPEYHRIRELIICALQPSRSTNEPDPDDDDIDD